ncbi:hypothetical protein LUX09_26800 [Streptomyces albogriseolus]|nr:hypothetical protein [Streptomyces albogriseolus]
MPEEIEIADKVGSVSADRYAQIVTELRKLRITRRSSRRSKQPASREAHRD